MSNSIRCLLDKAAARRIMEALLKLGTFGTSRDASVLGAQFVATFDQPMINNWRMQQGPIQKHLAAMRPHLRPAYRATALPQGRSPVLTNPSTSKSPELLHCIIWSMGIRIEACVSVVNSGSSPLSTRCILT